MTGLNRRLVWLTLFAVAMAYLESAVVVYLRALYYPAGFAFPLVPWPAAMVIIEIGREAATIVMLVAVARLASSDGWEWFLTFCISFGVWDLWSYLWLWLFIGWPESLLTWDVLFLIPVPWIGPVAAPVIISVALIAAAMWLLRLRERGVRLWFSRPMWGLAVTGGAIVLASFTFDFAAALEPRQPPPFRWGLFLTGVGVSLAALVMGVSRLDRLDARR